MLADYRTVVVPLTPTFQEVGPCTNLLALNGLDLKVFGRDVVSRWLQNQQYSYYTPHLEITESDFILTITTEDHLQPLLLRKGPYKDFEEYNASAEVLFYFGGQVLRELEKQLEPFDINERQWDNVEVDRWLNDHLLLKVFV